MMTTMTTKTRVAPASATRQTSRNVLEVCAVLRDLGCQVLGASANAGRGRVRVAQPMPINPQPSAVRRWSRWSQVHVAQMPNGVLIEWCTARRTGGAR